MVSKNQRDEKLVLDTIENYGNPFAWGKGSAWLAGLTRARITEIVFQLTQRKAIYVDAENVYRVSDDILVLLKI
jgi:hypothetical protein